MRTRLGRLVARIGETIGRRRIPTDAVPTQTSDVERATTPLPAPTAPASTSRRWWRPVPPGWSPAARHWPVLLIVVLAALLRYGRLSEAFLYGDDAEYATVVGYLVHNPLHLGYPDLQLAGPVPFVSQPPALLYLFALAAAVIGDVETAILAANATLGVATVVVSYFIGCRLAGRPAGAIGATFLAVLPMHVVLSRTGFLDVGLTFFMMLSLLCFLRWDEKRTAGRALLTGGVAAVTILTKLPGPLILFPLVGGLMWILGRRIVAARLGTIPPTPIRWNTVQTHGLLAALPIFGASAAYIGLLWHLQATRDLLLKIGWNMNRVTSTTGVGRPWHWYFHDHSFAVPPPYGWLALALAALGLAWVVKEAILGPLPRAAWAAVAFLPLVVAGFFALSARKEPFYILPLAPMACILAALPLALLLPHAGRFAQRLKPSIAKRAQPAAVVAVGLLVGLASFGLADTSYGAIIGTRGFGYGVKEAALLVESIDPDAGQFGTLLGRYGAHFYNGNPTFDVFAEPWLIDQRAQSGEIRFIIFDDYLDRPNDKKIMMDLVQRHNGEPRAQFMGQDGRVHVILFELNPRAPDAEG